MATGFSPTSVECRSAICLRRGRPRRGNTASWAGNLGCRLRHAGRRRPPGAVPLMPGAQRPRAGRSLWPWRGALRATPRRRSMVPGPAAAGRRLPGCLDWGWIRGSWVGSGRIWCEGCLSRVSARRGGRGGTASAFAAGAVWALWLGRVVGVSGVLGVVDVVRVVGRWLVDRDRPLTGRVVSWATAGWSWHLDALLAGGLPGARAPPTRPGSVRSPGDGGLSRGAGSVVRAQRGPVVDPVSLIASAWPSRMRDCDGGVRPESRCGQTGVHPWPRRRAHGRRRCARSVGCSSAGSPARGPAGP